MDDNIEKVSPYQRLQAILSDKKSSKDLKLTSGQRLKNYFLK